MSSLPSNPDGLTVVAPAAHRLDASRMHKPTMGRGYEGVCLPRRPHYVLTETGIGYRLRAAD